jgi:hypothetical protein
MQLMTVSSATASDPEPKPIDGVSRPNILVIFTDNVGCSGQAAKSLATPHSPLATLHSSLFTRHYRLQSGRSGQAAKSLATLHSSLATIVRKVVEVDDAFVYRIRRINTSRRCIAKAPGQSAGEKEENP